MYIRLISVEKCDEQLLNCLNCVKQDTTCEYRPKKRREIINESPPSALGASFTPASLEGTVFESSIPAGAVDLMPDVALNVSQLRLF